MSLSKREYDEYKAAVEKMVHKYVSRDRSSIISTITHAVDNSWDKRKLEDKLLVSLEKNVAYKLSDKAFSLVDKLGIELKHISKKRSHKADGEKEKSSKRSKVREDDITAISQKDRDGKTEVMDDAHAQEQIKSIMAKAQAAIEERKRHLANLQPPTSNVPNQTLMPPPPTNGTSVAANTLDVGSRIAELQARIQSQLGNASIPSLNAGVTVESPGLVIPGVMQGIPAPTLLPAFSPSLMPGVGFGGLVNNAAQVSGTQTPKPPGEKPTPLILDSEGRTVDLSGKEVHLTHRIPTLKANIRAKKREEFKQQLQEKPLEEAVESSFFDPRVTIRPSIKAHRIFKFHDPGHFVQVGQRERAKSRLEKLQSEITQIAKKTGISSAAKLAQLEQRDERISPDWLPVVEWWDEVILEKDRYPEDDSEEVKIKSNVISNLVEHPLEVRCPSDTTKPSELQVYLTKKERKKLRRMNRRETWKEKQEKIRLGLEPPPEPKVKLANLMRVLGTEAVLDPTKMEKHVREQMAKRLKAHEDANAARKLTPEQRRDKKINKLKEDTTVGVNTAVFRVTDLTNGSHKFKVETNAKQLFMTGTVVLFKDVNVVVVEGGPKQLKKFKKLMLERIKWAEESRSKDATIEPKCQLIWEGVVSERSFGDVQFKSCPSEAFGRDHFKKHGVEHYWDLAYGKKILDETEETS